jgi:transcriptional regulator NrdR family protein
MDVKDSRPSTSYGLSTIRRRRYCRACDFRLTTYELVDGNKLHQELGEMIDTARLTVRLLSSLIEAYEKFSVQAHSPPEG